MYIHIGGGYVLRDEDIIGFFDIDGTHSSDITKEFLKKYESEARTDLAGEDLPRSFVLPDETKVYPGHGDNTTIGHEKIYNPFCQ